MCGYANDKKNNKIQPDFETLSFHTCVLYFISTTTQYYEAAHLTSFPLWSLHPSDHGYKQRNAQDWSEEHVLEFISEHVDRLKFDASQVSLASCTMDGRHLCHMTEGQMLQDFGPYLGSELHHSLSKYVPKTRYGKFE